MSDKLFGFAFIVMVLWWFLCSVVYFVGMQYLPDNNLVGLIIILAAYIVTYFVGLGVCARILEAIQHG